MPTSPEGLQRIGICFIDAETFWWDATHSPTCPLCSTDSQPYDDALSYDEGHKFFVPEALLSESSREKALTRISDPSYVGSYEPEQVVEIYREWARLALAGPEKP